MNDLQLLCLVEGDSTVFEVTVARHSRVTALKELVHDKGIDATKNTVLAKDLKLWKVSPFHRPAQTLWVTSRRSTRFHDLTG